MTKTIIFIIFVLHFISTVSFAQDNAGPCTCDLTQSACDPNCCCDLECNATDIQAFSACSNDYSYSSVQTCFPSSIMYRNYTPYSINATGGDGLACIYYDRFTARNYYTSPQVENSNITKLALKAQAYAGFNFSVTNAATDYSVYSASYKAGTPVHTIYEAGNPSYLSQPSAATNSPLCSYAAPARFMSSAATSCVRTVSSAVCTTDGALRLGSFVLGFRVVPQPSVLTGSAAPNYTDLTEVVQASVTCRALNGSTVACVGDTNATALNAAGVCSNVLTSLTYNINYGASAGIYQITYDAVLGSYDVSSGTSYALKQTFASVYNLSLTASPAASARSGNPGYLVGKPVLAGVRNVSRNSVQLNADPNLWLTVPGAASDGSCLDGAARSVEFGESLQSSCWRGVDWTSGVGIDASACANVEVAVRASLAGLGVAGETVVGRYGNADSASLSTDWVSIHVDNATCAVGQETQLAGGGGCVNLMLGGKLELLMARTGSVANPQSSLVGARLSCVRGNLTFQCSAGSCSSGNFTQRFLSSYSISFLDASSTPTSGESVSSSSIFQLRLMKDFFYLLYVENGVAVAGPGSVLFLLSLVAAGRLLLLADV